MIITLLGCLEAPLSLPPSRQWSPSSGMMVQYDGLKGFLVKRGEVETTHIWIAPQLDEHHKKCALLQVTQNTQALLILNKDIRKAQEHYASSSQPPQTLICP